MKSLKILKKHQSIYTGGKTLLHFYEEILFIQNKNKVICLDIDSGEVFYQFEIKRDGFTCFECTPNGLYIALSCKSTLIKIAELKKQKYISEFRGHTQPVNAMSFDPTSVLLATASTDKTIRVWNYLEGFCIYRFRGHIFPVQILCFHPSAEQLELFSGGQQGLIKIFLLKKKKENVIELKNHNFTITDFSFFDKGKKMISSGRDQIITVWDLTTYRIIQTIPIYEGIEFINIFKNLVLYGGEKGIIYIATFMNLSIPIKRFTISTYCIKFFLQSSSKENWIVVTEEHNFQILNNFDFVIQKTIIGFNDQIIDIELVPNDKEVLLATNSNEPRLMSLSNFHTTLLQGHSKQILSVSIHYSGLIATASKDKTIRIWELQTKHCVAICEGHLEGVSGVTFFEHDLSFVSVARDQTLKLWKLNKISFFEGKLKKIRTNIGSIAHSKDITCLAVSPNDTIIASGSMDKIVKLWTRELINYGDLRGHSRVVHSVVFSPNDKIIVTASGDKTVKLWSLNNQTCLKTFEGHTSSVTKVSFLNNGTEIISTGGDGLLKIWNIKTGFSLNTFEEHDHIWCLSVSKTSNLIITGDTDSVLNVWQDITKEEVEVTIKKEHKKQLFRKKLKILINQKRYLEASQLCIILDQPKSLFNILKVLCKKNKFDKEFSELLTSLKVLELGKLLVYCQYWNLNIKHTYLLTRILNSLLQTYSAKNLAKLPIENYSNFLKTLIKYNQKHFNRVNNLVCRSYLFDFLLDSMNHLFYNSSKDKKNKL